MIMRVAVALLMSALVLCGAQCGSVSLPPGEVGLSLTLRDSGTKAFVSNATVIAESGEYETWLVDGRMPGIYHGAYRAGVYKVSIVAGGYKGVVLDNLLVVSEGTYLKGVKGPTLQIELEKEE